MGASNAHPGYRDTPTPKILLHGCFQKQIGQYNYNILEINALAN